MASLKKTKQNKNISTRLLYTEFTCTKVNLVWIYLRKDLRHILERIRVDKKKKKPLISNGRWRLRTWLISRKGRRRGWKGQRTRQSQKSLTLIKYSAKPSWNMLSLKAELSFQNRETWWRDLEGGGADPDLGDLFAKHILIIQDVHRESKAQSRLCKQHALSHLLTSAR